MQANSFTKLVSIVVVAMFTSILMPPQTCYAANASQAKAAGHVRERGDGYVQPTSGAHQDVADAINAARRAEYERRAAALRKKGIQITADQIARQTAPQLK